jgi:hypothetical protein
MKKLMMMMMMTTTSEYALRIIPQLNETGGW